MADYQLTGGDLAVIRTYDEVWVPNNPDNPAWQQYLAWLAAGNTPDPYVPEQMPSWLTT